MFSETGLSLSATGVRYVEASLVNEDYREALISKSVSTWMSKVNNLRHMALTQPHVVLSPLGMGLSCKWTCFTRTVAEVSLLLAPTEQALRDKFIPSVTVRCLPGKSTQTLLSLLTRIVT